MRLRSFDWEGQDIVDLPGAGGKHQQTVETDGNASAFRQAVLQRCQQKLVHLVGGKPESSALDQIVFEATALFAGRGQLVEAIGQLDPFAVELKPESNSSGRWDRGERGRPGEAG